MYNSEGYRETVSELRKLLTCVLSSDYFHNCIFTLLPSSYVGNGDLVVLYIIVFYHLQITKGGISSWQS